MMLRLISIFILSFVIICLSCCNSQKQEPEDKNDGKNIIKDNIQKLKSNDESLERVNALLMNFNESYLLTDIWISKAVRRDERNKAKLLKLINNDISSNMEKLQNVSGNNSSIKSNLDSVKALTGFLTGKYHIITDSLLANPEDYHDFKSGSESFNVLLAFDVYAHGNDLSNYHSKVVQLLGAIKNQLLKERKVIYSSLEE